MAKTESKIRRWWRERRTSRGAFRGRIKIQTWQLLAALVPLLFIDATLLRIDHLRMVELRDAVLAADEAEDDEAVLTALKKLHEFTVSNMVINIVEKNGVSKVTFGTGPFYLEHTYIRDANKALEEAEKKLSSDANPNGNVYAAAGQFCRSEALKYGWTWDNANFINCMVSEINKYPAADDLQDQLIAALPSTELYRREFASPVFAPTLTGLCVLITLAVLLVILVRMVIWVVVRVALIFV